MRSVTMILALTMALTGCKDKPSDLDEDGVPDLDDCAPEDADYSEEIAWQNDRDGDGFGVTSYSCLPPENPVTQSGDCDDGNDQRYPGAEEVCDEVDQDCDGEADEDAIDGVRWSRDKDDDDYGSVSGTITACKPPFGYISEGGDCNDNDANIHPGMDEVCDGVDEDCDGTVDDHPLGAPSFYRDADDDGYGTDADWVSECSKPAGYVGVSGDCDDEDDLLNPGMTELCNTFDDDCDGLTDYDDDPAAPDGTWYLDADGDGWGTPDTTTTSCEWPDGYARRDLDCDDSTAAVSPDATEVCLDGYDNDCDGAAPGCGSEGEGTLADEWGAWLGTESGVGIGFGRSITEIGDWNGDGVSELAFGLSNGATYGAVYIVNGGGTGGAVTDGVTLTGESDYLGYALAPVGDANGDAVADLVVGAPVSGVVYLLAGPVVTGSDAYSAAEAALVGPSGSQLGESVESAGDQDGDGLPDLLMGGTLDNAGGGGVYVVSGTVAGDVDVASAAIASIAGASGTEGIGWSASAGDFTGDGVADVVVGGPGDAYATGAGWLLEGPLTGALTTADGTPIYSEQSGSSATNALELRGDYDGDGYADLVAAASAWDDATSADAGRVYVVLAPFLEDEVPLADADLFFDGQLGALCGYSMSYVGSPNGDDIPDLAIGCPLGWDPTTQKGYSALVYGGMAAGTYPIASTGRRWAGSVDFETVGGAVGPAGDQDQDGVDDFLISAAYASDGVDYGGKISILLGESAF
jgi:hypothetical protein